MTTTSRNRSADSQGAPARKPGQHPDLRPDDHGHLRRHRRDHGVAVQHLHQQLGHRERDPAGVLPLRVRDPVRRERAPAERVLADRTSTTSTPPPSRCPRRARSTSAFSAPGSNPPPTRTSPAVRLRSSSKRARSRPVSSTASCRTSFRTSTSSLTAGPRRAEAERQRNRQGVGVLGHGRKRHVVPVRCRRHVHRSAANKRICMAIQPSADQTFTPTGDAGAYLDLKQSAAQIFPKTDGAFKYDGQIYFYQSAKEESGYFRLSYITPGPNTGTARRVGRDGHRLHPPGAQQLLRHLQGHLSGNVELRRGHGPRGSRWRATPPRT